MQLAAEVCGTCHVGKGAAGDESGDRGQAFAESTLHLLPSVKEVTTASENSQTLCKLQNHCFRWDVSHVPTQSRPMFVHETDVVCGSVNVPCVPGVFG